MDIILWGGIAWLTTSAALAFVLGRAIKIADTIESADLRTNETHDTPQR